MADDIEYKNFLSYILPQLPLHYRREALENLEQKSPWLKTLASAEPDLISAKDEFFKDGTQCIHDLEEHITLFRLAVANERLTKSYSNLYITFMAEISATKPGPTRMFPDWLPDMLTQSQLTMFEQRRKELSESIKTEGTVGSLDTFYEAAQRILNASQNGSDVGTLQYSSRKICGVFEEARKRAETTPSETYVKSSSEKLLHSLHSGYKRGIWRLGPGSTPQIPYNSNIKDFTYKVGCPEAHQEPERNIAELRKFHSSQTPFFRQLQDDLKEQIQLNNQQQEIITALVFRHLLESLPPEHTRSGATDATARWREFWEDAVRHELRNPNEDHPLHELMPLSALTNTGTFSDGMKGLTFRTGRDLFGTLSTNIHKYKGGGRKGYNIVRNDQWGSQVRDILTRLIPKEFDNSTGEVNWEDERKRYTV